MRYDIISASAAIAVAIYLLRHIDMLGAGRSLDVVHHMISSRATSQRPTVGSYCQHRRR